MQFMVKLSRYLKKKSTTTMVSEFAMAVAVAFCAAQFVEAAKPLKVSDEKVQARLHKQQVLEDIPLVVYLHVYIIFSSWWAA